MKKGYKKILICSLLCLLPLAACREETASSTSEETASSTSKESSSQISSESDQELTVAELLETLNQMADEGVYDIEYIRSRETYVDTLNSTEGYYWTDYPGYGYGYLPNFPGREDAFFSYGYEDGKLTNVNREVSVDNNTGATLSTQPTMASLNVFAALKSYLSEEYFTQESSTEVVVSDNNLFAIYMSILLNYTTTSNIDSYICNTTFTKDSNGWIHFAITANSHHVIFNHKEYSGILKNIGTAKNETIAKAVKEYAFPTEQLSAKAQETLNSTAQEMDFTFYQTVIDSKGVGETSIVATMKSRYDYDEAFYLTYSTSSVTDAQLYLKFVDKTSYTLTTKALDARTGDTTDSFIRSVGDYTYSTLKLFTPGGCLDTSCFYGSNGEYEYYGGNVANSIYFLSSESLLLLPYAPTSSIKVKTDANGDIEKMTTVSSGFADDEGNSYIYSFEFTFKDLDSNPFPEPSGKKDTAETLAFKTKYLDGKLDGTGNVKIESGSDKLASRADYIEADGVLLIHKYGYDGNYDDGYILNPAKDTYTGYKYDEDENGLIPFTLTKNDDGTFSVASVSYLKAGTLSSNFKPFSFASSLIESTENANEYKIVLGDLVNLSNILLFDSNMQNVITMESTTSLLRLSDLNIKTDGDYITSVDYEISYSLKDEDGNDYPGTKYETKYTYNVSQDANVLAAIESIEAKVPLKTWQEESSDIWEALVALLGEDEAANVPYLFHEQISGQWKRYVTSSTQIRLYVTQEEEYFDDEFYTEYGELLVEKGWTKLEDYVEKQPSGEIVTHHYYQDTAGTVITFSDSRGWSPFFDVYKPGSWKSPK